MHARLLYVMDPMCSWCWGFAPVFQALANQAAEQGVPTDLVLGGLRRDRIAIDAATRDRYLGYWQQVNANTGQPFNFAAGLPEGMLYDTEAACRAVVTMRRLFPEKTWPMALSIQQAFYQQGLDVTRACHLVQLAEAQGVARHAFAEAFDSHEQQRATVADFNWVQGLGIAGFPTLLAERDGSLALLTNGYQPLTTLSPLLARWLEHAAPN
jgi:putative protein-disulfide isomerase